MSKFFESGHALIMVAGADLPNTADDARGLIDILRDPALLPTSRNRLSFSYAQLPADPAYSQVRTSWL